MSKNTAFCVERFGGDQWFMSAFWNMDDKKANNLNFIVHHDNEKIVEVLKIQERMKVRLLEKNGQEFNEKILDRWAFKGQRATDAELLSVKIKFADKKLKGLQKPSYEDIHFINTLKIESLKDRDKL